MKSGDQGVDAISPPPSVDGAEAFVGRARALERTLQAAEALKLGQGRLVVVSGEIGMGTSRFCTEVAQRARSAGIRSVEARCWLHGGAPPLWPWQSVLAQLGGEGTTPLAAGTALYDAGADRFARFVAVTDCLADVCTSGPVCLVIDDVQGADYGTLLLVRFVARSLSRFPLLLVLGRCREPPANSETAHILDEIEREATSVVLDGFDLAETEAFLTSYGLDPPDPHLVATLLGLTRGNPLHLQRIVQTVGTTTPASDVQGGLGVAIRRAFDDLDKESRLLLAVGAVLGTDPTVAETAEVAGCDPVAVLDAVQQGAAIGLIAQQGEGRLTFSHDLVRSVIEDDLSVTDRLQTHARASTMLVEEGRQRPERMARAAHHARQAAPRSELDADWAVVVCEAAARTMLRNFAYEEADELFSTAVELHTSERLGPPTSLLALEWANAAALRGHMNAARDRYSYAITLAEEEGRPSILAEAALGYGGVWLDHYPSPADKARILTLCTAAHRALEERDERWEGQRCRLQLRLVAEATYQGGGRPVEDLQTAIEAARASGDPRALAESLSLAQHGLFTQEHTRTRPVLNAELLEVTSGTDLGVLTLMGQLWRTVNALHLGDPQFGRYLEVLREHATALGNQHMIYNVFVMDVLVAIGQGRLADAEVQAGRCYELGSQIGRVDAFPYYTTQLGVMRWLQGRDAELVDQVRDLAQSPTVADTEVGVWALAACLAARSGNHDQARSILNHRLPADLADLVPSGTWMAGMVAIVEAAAALRDRVLAAKAYDMLLPYAELPAVVGLGIACLGSVERSLGLAAGVLGHHDLAVNHLERAVDANHRLLNDALRAVARADLAMALTRRADARHRDGSGSDAEDSSGSEDSDDRAMAADLLRLAIVDGTTFGLTNRVPAWEAQLAALTVPAADPARSNPKPRRPDPESVSDAGSPTTGQATIRKEGRRWSLRVDGRRIRVPNLVGMRYIAELLTNPGKRIPSVVLAGKRTGPAQPHRQELLDNQARAAYTVRARELAADLAEADAANDLHRAEKLRAQIDLLVDQLKEASGLGDRPRHFPDDHERARVAVQKAIKRALDAVEDADAKLADALRQTISTGVTCVYVPDAQTPAHWTARDVHAKV